MNKANNVSKKPIELQVIYLKSGDVKTLTLERE